MGRGPAHHCLLLLLAALAWAWPTVVVAAPRLEFELVDDETVVRGCPGEQRPVRLRLRNTGDTTWRDQDRDRVAYHWRDPSGAMLIRDGERTLLSRPVRPGEEIQVEARLKLPDEPGAYLLQWRMVRESVSWYPSADTPRRAVDVVGEGPALAWSLEVDRLPDFPAGETVEVPVHLENLGCAPWRADHHDALTYRWLDEDGEVQVAEGLRTPLPDVEPGGRVAVVARVVAPGREGPHRLQFEPVREGITWFGPGQSSPASVTVQPGPLRWSLLSELALPKLAARSITTVSVQLRNEGTATWSSKAGDQLSYRWRDSDGKPLGEGIRTSLPNSVEPGESASVELRVAAPDDPGQYTFEVRPVREHVRWYGPPIDGPDRAPVVVEASALEWSVVDVRAPLWFWARRSGSARVTIRNEGSSTWSPSTSDRLTYRWLDDVDEVIVPEGRRFEVPHDVAPGESVTLDVEFIGPAGSGPHVLELRMVREHVAWFGPPADPDVARVHLTGVWQSTSLGMLLAFAVGVMIALRRVPRWRSRVGWLEPWVWPVWLGTCVWLLSEAFADLSGVEFFEAGRFVGLSCGALAGAALAAIGRAPRALALAAATFLSTLVIADLAYIDFFGSLVPLAALAALDHLSDAGGSVASLLRPAYAWVLLLPMTGVALAVGTGRLRRSTGYQRWAPVVLLLAGGLPAAGVLASTQASKTGNRVFSEYRNAGRLSVVGAHLFQVMRAVTGLWGPGTLSPQERRDVEDFYQERRSQRAASSASSAVAPGYNVVLLQVEALQHWAMDAEVDGQTVMPFLHDASQSALVFDHVFDQTAQGRTSDAEYLALASNHALAEGALSFLRADADFLTVAHVLSNSGYTTLSAHPYRRGFWNRAALHPRYGFDASIFQRELGRGTEVGWGLADGPFLERMAGRLAEVEQPFFAFLITLSLHHPYDDFPSNLREMELGELEDTSVGNYLHAMRHFDSALSSFFDRLRDADLAERTIVVLYGDHVTGMGEPPEVLELAEAGDWTPSTPAVLHRIPVVIWVPGEHELRGRFDRVGGHIDLAPTVLHLLGVAAPPSFVGTSLTARSPWAALPSGSAASGDRLFVADGDDIPVGGACFDFPRGSLRPRQDCVDLEQRAGRELAASRAVLNHDLFRVLGVGPP